MLSLQRLVGNGAVAHLLGSTPSPAAATASVRWAAKPTTLDDAIRTSGSDELDPFRPFPGIPRTNSCRSST
jgi:hypothetical protein